MKKRMRKLMAVALTVAMSAGILAGCGSGDGSDNGKAKLTFGIWDPDQKPAMEALADAYTKENPDVSIEIQLTPWKDYWTKLEASATGGVAPDVFWINTLHSELYQEGGILADLTDAVEKSDIGLDENYEKTLVDSYKIDGKLYAIPKDVGTVGLWYNKEIFDKAGVERPTDDWTWEDMLQAAEQLQGKMEEGTYAIAAPVEAESYIPTIIAAGGNTISEDKTAPTYTMPETMEGVQCWIDLIDKGYSPTTEELTDSPVDVRFQSGKLAMHVGGSYMATQYWMNEETKDKVDVVEYPSYNGQEPNQAGGLGYAVYEKSKQKEAAIDFAVWLGSEEAMKIQGEEGSVITARTDTQKYFAEKIPEWNLEAFTNHIDVAPAMPYCKSMAELKTLETEKYTEAYSGKKTIQEASEELQKEAQEVYDRMNEK